MTALGKTVLHTTALALSPLHALTLPTPVGALTAVLTPEDGVVRASGFTPLDDVASRLAPALRERGVEVSDVDEQPWGRFVYLSDPDGNGWALQQLPAWRG